MVHVVCAYLPEKQMPRTFWFFAIIHAAHIMNAIPANIHGHLGSPLLLIQGIGHDKHDSYFHHEKEGDQKRSKTLAHTMDGVIVGRSPTLNARPVYTLCNKQYCKPNSYQINSYWLLGSVYRDIMYDGGLFCTLVIGRGSPYGGEIPS